MVSLKVAFMSVLCVFLLNLENAVAGPMEISTKYLKGNLAEQNDWITILSSIEHRLKNLDNLYTSQLTPTLETRLEHFQNRISGMEVKLLRVEALLTNKLDRMSDNISSRHFRDDMVQTDLFRKIETSYDGVTHRLAYMDRKEENGFLKTQGKMDVILKKLEKIDDTLTTTYESLESGLSDCETGMENLRSFSQNMEKKIVVSLEKHTNVSLQKHEEMQNFSKTNILPELADAMSIIRENATKNFDSLRRKINYQILMSNTTDKSMNKFSEDLAKVLNDYASKVSDLGEQVTKSDKKIASHLNIIESVANSTRSDIQNGLRALMIQVGKISYKENGNYGVANQGFLSDMDVKLDSNFGKIIATQNSFLESCHRLQMDESQLESQISDILNKLIDNFSKTAKEEHHLLKKIEGLLVKHDIHSKRELHQANTNIQVTFEQSKQDVKGLNEQLHKTVNNLEALFALVENMQGSKNTNVKRDVPTHKSIRGQIDSLGKAINFTQFEQVKMSDSYRSTIETLINIAKSKEGDQQNIISIMKNITENIRVIKENMHNISENLDTNITSDILNTLKNSHELIKENSQNVKKILNSVVKDANLTRTSTGNEQSGRSLKPKSSNTTKNDVPNIDDIIRQVFLNNNSVTTTQKMEIACLDVDIDVRYEGNKIYKNCGNQTQNVTTENYDSNETDCLDFDMDVRFLQDDNSTTVRPFRKCQKASITQEESTLQTEENTKLYPTEETTTLEPNCHDDPIDVKFDPQDQNNHTLKLCKNSTTQTNVTNKPIIDKQPNQIILPKISNDRSNNSTKENVSSFELKNSTEYIKQNELVN